MSALSDRPLAQSDASRGVEVWRQTLLEPLTDVTVGDPSWLATFHGGTVDLLQRPPTEREWKSNFSCGVWPTAVDEVDLNLGAAERALAITTAFYYKEPLATRQSAESGVEDLVYYLTAAALSQRQLVWKTTWAGDPPAGSSIVKGGDGMAVRRGRIFPANFNAWYDEAESCTRVLVQLDVAWIQQIQTC